MHISETDLNKIMDALMSRDETQCLIAQSFIVNAKDAKASGALREAALDRVMNEFHATDEIEIDDDAGTSASDEGTWVQAWVYVPNPEEDDEESPDIDLETVCPVDRAALADDANRRAAILRDLKERESL